jgi:hypothetical protein
MKAKTSYILERREEVRHKLSLTLYFCSATSSLISSLTESFQVLPRMTLDPALRRITIRSTRASRAAGIQHGKTTREHGNQVWRTRQDIKTTCVCV